MQVRAVEHVAAFGVVAFGQQRQRQVVGLGFALLAGQVAEQVELAGPHLVGQREALMGLDADKNAQRQNVHGVKWQPARLKQHPVHPQALPDERHKIQEHIEQEGGAYHQQCQPRKAAGRYQQRRVGRGESIAQRPGGPHYQQRIQLRRAPGIRHPGGVAGGPQAQAQPARQQGWQQQQQRVQAHPRKKLQGPIIPHIQQQDAQIQDARRQKRPQSKPAARLLGLGIEPEQRPDILDTHPQHQQREQHRAAGGSIGSQLQRRFRGWQLTLSEQ